MKVIVLVLVFTAFAQAEDRVGASGGKIEITARAEKLTKDNENPSWRNTQNILMGFKKIRCRKGGANPKEEAIPVLATEGFCNQRNDDKSPDDFPPGTVWVYQDGDHGSTVVKLKNGAYFGEYLMSAPPPVRKDLRGVMVPGCGEKEKTCHTTAHTMKDMNKLEKEADAAKLKRLKKKDAGGMPTKVAKDDNSVSVNEILSPSPERLKAEEECGYANAFRSPNEFNVCVNGKLKSAH